ncbi:MAG: glycosyltransferase family 39 protein [Phototrophicaceae bacterium]
MSKFTSLTLAVLLLLIAAALRIVGLPQAPPGLSANEVRDAQIVELVRLGRVEVIYDTGTEGREGLYHILVSILTFFIGSDPFGYRMPSVWMWLLAASLVYALGRRLYGRLAALTGLTFMVLPLSTVLMARQLRREALLPLLASAVLLALVRALPIDRRPNLTPNTLPFALLGLFLGLGFYIHPAHYALVLAVMAVIGYMLFTRQPMSRRTLSYLSFTLVIVVIVAMPYLLSALRSPELGGVARLFNELTTVREQGIGQTLLNNLGGWVLRGDMNPQHNTPGRPFIDPITALVALIGLGYSLRRIGEPRYALALIVFLALFPVALLSANSPNFLGYSAVIPLVALMFGLGVKAMQRNLPRRWMQWGWLVLLGANLAWTGWSLYGVWSQSDVMQTIYNERLYQLAAYLDRTAEDTNTVICTPRLPSSPAWLSAPNQPVTLVTLMMDDQAAESNLRYVDCGSGIIFTNGGGHEQVILLEENALENAHPYVQAWLQQGDLLASTPTANSVISLNVETSLGDTIGRFTTTAPAGYAPESPGGVAPALLPVSFSDGLTFLGYESLASNVYAPGDIVTLITYWRADERLPRNLRLFHHLLFDAERIVAQSDTLSILPQRLQARDVWVQVTFLTLPEGLPPGSYQTAIGAYLVDEENPHSLAVLDNGQARGVRLFLSEIEVQAKP